MFGGAPTRYRNGGTRGGQGKFDFADVKNDKHRENYLGHSLHAPVGRWCIGKDLQWWSKKQQTDVAPVSDEERLRQEKEIIKQQDEDLLLETLGLKPKEHRTTGETLDTAATRQLFKRGEYEKDDRYAERQTGIGSAPVKRHEHVDRTLSAQALEQHRLTENRFEGDQEDTFAVPGDVIRTKVTDLGPEKREKKEEEKKKRKREKKHKHRHEKRKHKRRRRSSPSRSPPRRRDRERSVSRSPPRRRDRERSVSRSPPRRDSEGRRRRG